VHFIGCHSFDYLADSVINHSPGGNVVFIGNAFENELLFAWNEENKIQFLDQLFNLVARYKKKIVDQITSLC